MAAKTSTPTPLTGTELVDKLLGKQRLRELAGVLSPTNPGERIPTALEVKAALEELLQAPAARTLRQLVLDGRSLSAVARELGVARSTLREQLDRKDMQLTTLDKLLEVAGYDLEIVASKDGKRFTVAMKGSS